MLTPFRFTMVFGTVQRWTSKKDNHIVTPTILCLHHSVFVRPAIVELLDIDERRHERKL